MFPGFLWFLITKCLSVFHQRLLSSKLPQAQWLSKVIPSRVFCPSQSACSFTHPVIFQFSEKFSVFCFLHSWLPLIKLFYHRAPTPCPGLFLFVDSCALGHGTGINSPMSCSAILLMSVTDIFARVCFVLSCFIIVLSSISSVSFLGFLYPNAMAWLHCQLRGRVICASQEGHDSIRDSGRSKGYALVNGS